MGQEPLLTPRRVEAREAQPAPCPYVLNVRPTLLPVWLSTCSKTHDRRPSRLAISRKGAREHPYLFFHFYRRIRPFPFTVPFTCLQFLRQVITYYCHGQARVCKKLLPIALLFLPDVSFFVIFRSRGLPRKDDNIACCTLYRVIITNGVKALSHTEYGKACKQ